jgi:hypothetical protein
LRLPTGHTTKATIKELAKRRMALTNLEKRKQYEYSVTTAKSQTKSYWSRLKPYYHISKISQLKTSLKPKTRTGQKERKQQKGPKPKLSNFSPCL